MGNVQGTKNLRYSIESVVDLQGAESGGSWINHDRHCCSAKHKKGCTKMVAAF